MATHLSLFNKLIDWHQAKHPEFNAPNEPQPDSAICLTSLVTEILEPIESKLGSVTITYGFNSGALNRYIQRVSAKDTGPKEDQHASMELNLAGKRICQREGAACDLLVEGYEQRMHLVAKFITEHLPFDRMYFYGSNKPLHISFGPDHSRYIQYRKTREDGKRVLGKVIKREQASVYFSNDIR
ncbi:hypothetical protein [Vibrio comitans]